MSKKIKILKEYFSYLSDVSNKVCTKACIDYLSCKFTIIYYSASFINNCLHFTKEMKNKFYYQPNK